MVSVARWRSLRPLPNCCLFEGTPKKRICRRTLCFWSQSDSMKMLGQIFWKLRNCQKRCPWKVPLQENVMCSYTIWCVVVHWYMKAKGRRPLPGFFVLQPWLVVLNSWINQSKCDFRIKWCSSIPAKPAKMNQEVRNHKVLVSLDPLLFGIFISLQLGSVPF